MKVIVKLANIELTPDRPYYNGASWHIEGTDMEDIVATVTWFYDIENTTDSFLDFRAPIDKDIMSSTEQPLHPEYKIKKYGILSEMPRYEVLRSMAIKLNRFLVWTNELQQRVPKFELKDRTKPGHRKIVAFFVCQSPKYSSDRVLPQQPTWYETSGSNSPTIENLVNTVTLSGAEANNIRLEIINSRKERRVEAIADDDSYSSGTE